jgi:hypothetical protein
MPGSHSSLTCETSQYCFSGNLQQLTIRPAHRFASREPEHGQSITTSSSSSSLDQEQLCCWVAGLLGWMLLTTTSSTINITHNSAHNDTAQS